MLSFKKSFRLSKDRGLKESVQNQAPQTAVLLSEKSGIDVKRRSFLKTLGVIGAGVVGASILPKKSSAMTMGAKPGTGILGVKNSSDTRIDPITQGTLDSSRIATEATKISFDGIKTNTDTLVTNSNKFTFAGSDLNVVKGVDADSIILQDNSANTISANSEDAIVMLRRIVKQMESKATVDVANRRRVTVDAWGTNLSGPLDSGTATGTQSLIQLVDTTKFASWIENRWSYFAVKIIAGTGLDQVRMIASNNSTILTLVQPWTTAPDATSVYGIYDVAMPIVTDGTATGTQGLLTLADTTKAWTASAFINFAVRISGAQGDTQVRLITANTSTVLTYATPWTPILGITENLETGIATGEQSITTFVDTSKTWTVDAWIGYVLHITGGSGIDQAMVVASNTADTLTFTYPWLIQPDATSTYALRTLPIDATLTGTASSPPMANNLFDDLTKTWTTNVWANYLIKITSGMGAGQIRQIASNTATTLTLIADWTLLPSINSTYAIYPVPARQYAISAVPSANIDVGTVAGMPRFGIGTDSTVGTVTDISSLYSVGLYVPQQRFGDISHKVYNDSIRSRLTFN
jgi:hypothetical protein